jgi:hypothetical protein
MHSGLTDPTGGFSHYPPQQDHSGYPFVNELAGDSHNQPAHCHVYAGSPHGNSLPHPAG